MLRVLLRSVLESLAETLTLCCSPTPDTVMMSCVWRALAGAAWLEGSVLARVTVFRSMPSLLLPSSAHHIKKHLFLPCHCQTTRRSATVQPMEGHICRPQSALRARTSRAKPSPPNFLVAKVFRSVF